MVVMRRWWRNLRWRRFRMDLPLLVLVCAEVPKAEMEKIQKPFGTGIRSHKLVAKIPWGKLLSQSSQREPTSVVLLEVLGTKGVVKLNGKTVIIKAGDELVFSSSGKDAHIFQLLMNTKLTTSIASSSVSVSESQNALVKGPSSLTDFQMFKIKVERNFNSILRFN